MARTLQQVKKKQEDLQKEKLEILTKFRDHLKQVEEVQGLSKRGINAGKRIIEIEKEETANHKPENWIKRTQLSCHSKVVQKQLISVTDSVDHL